MKEFFKIILYKPLFNILIVLMWLIPGHSIGWAIIALTIIIRTILLPSSIKMIKSQKKMKLLQPELKKLNEQFKGDRQAQATAQMDLYKRHKINPWGSCLITLVQLPILIILYKVFITSVNNGGDYLLYSFTPHLDSLNTTWLGLNLATPDKWILPIITGLAQLVQSWQMKQLTATPAPKNPGEKTDKADDFTRMLNSQMLFMMPIFTVIIGMRMPAALVLYWLVQTIYAVVQTYFVMKSKDKDELKHEIAEEDAAAPAHILPEVTQTTEANEQPVKPKRKSLADRMIARKYKPRDDVIVQIRRKE
jgi:YidC/Oxa1 family membrane protein insertase